MNIMIFYSMTLIIILIILLLNKFLSMIKKMNFEKNLPYECDLIQLQK